VVVPKVGACYDLTSGRIWFRH